MAGATDGQGKFWHLPDGKRNLETRQPIDGRGNRWAGEFLASAQWEERAVGQFGCHLGAIWVVIWESFGESFGASFGSHFPLPWELPNSHYLRFIGHPLPEPTTPYIVAKTAPKRGAPKESIRLLLTGAVDVGKAPRKRPPHARDIEHIY